MANDREFDSLSVKEVEEVLCRIDEVKAVKVTVNRENAIEEVHVLADPGRGPKQLARDIESTLMAQYGLPVNHRKISIVQMGEKGAVNGQKTRLKILSINTETTAIYATVTVQIQFNGDRFEGMAKGPSSQTGRVRLIALATLNVLEKITKNACSFALEDVGIMSLGREKVAVACVSLVTQLGEEVFAGSAVVRQTENDSVVRATLDAINRRFNKLLSA